jgi:hypothetical protein
VLHAQARATLRAQVSEGAFVDVETGFLTRRQLWRPARPVLVVISSVILAFAAHSGRWRFILGSAAIVICCVLFGTGLLLRRHLYSQPTRAVLGLESELIGLVLLVVCGFALVLYALASLTASGADKTTGYFVGVLAGACVGYFSKEIFKPNESSSWFAVHYRHVMNARFTAYFYRRDANGNWVQGMKGRWDPRGVESDALVANYYLDGDVEISGWNASSRRLRARTLETGLQADPWVPPQPIKSSEHDNREIENKNESPHQRG